MTKYAVTYEEVYQKTFIVEADSPEEAEEKMEYAAENITLDMDDAFDHWNIGTAKKASRTDLIFNDPLIVGEKKMTIELKGHGKISANKYTLNYISILAEQAALQFSENGMTALAEEAQEIANDIYNILSETGLYK